MREKLQPLAKRKRRAKQRRRKKRGGHGKGLEGCRNRRNWGKNILLARSTII